MKSDDSLKFLLLTVAGFWLLNYVIRPVIFIYSERYGINSAVYDSRIGNNSEILANILFLIVTGCGVFTLTQFVRYLFHKNDKTHQYIDKISTLDSEIMIYRVLFFGLVAMLVEETPLQNPISKSLAICVPISLAVFFWNKTQTRIKPWQTFLFLSLTVTSILLYSKNSGNFKGIILTPILVFLFKMDFWKSDRPRSAKIGLIGLLTLGFIPLFKELQRIKLGNTQVDLFSNYQERLPSLLSPLLNLAVRFDQFARVTDSVSAEPGVLGNWRNGLGFVVHEFQLNPSSSSTSRTFGQIWNQSVTNQSIPGSRFSDVSLGQGMIASGYIWNGWITVVAESLLVSLTFLFLAFLLRGNLIRKIFAFALIGNATFFEAGLIQIASNITSGLKIVIFFSCFEFLFRASKSKVNRI
jgi:hypothetical protein